jgi:TolA-binding protein
MVIATATLETLQRHRRFAPVAVVLALAVGVALSALAGGAPDPAARLERARDLLVSRHPDAALREVRRALAELGDDGDARLRLHALSRAAQIVDLHFSGHATDEALTAYRQLAAAFPGTPEGFDAGVRIAELLRDRGAPEAAEKQLVSVFDAFPAQPGAERLLLRAARLALDARSYERARAHAERLVDAFPQAAAAADARTLVGSTYHLEGRHADAARAFEAVAKGWPDTEVAAHALFEAASCQVELADFDRAIASYIAALPRHPNPQLLQRGLEKARRQLTALRAMAPGSKEVAYGPGGFPLQR